MPAKSTWLELLSSEDSSESSSKSALMPPIKVMKSKLLVTGLVWALAMVLVWVLVILLLNY